MRKNQRAALQVQIITFTSIVNTKETNKINRTTQPAIYEKKLLNFFVQVNFNTKLLNAKTQWEERI